MRPQVPNPQDKPALDERGFELLLAAAYALQMQSDRLSTKDAKVHCAQTLSEPGSAEPVGPIKLPEKDAEPAQTEPVHFARPPLPHRTARKRYLLNDELFWKVATAATVAAVSALLLGASAHRFSPLPPAVLLPSEVAHKPMPFQGRKRILRSPIPLSWVGTKGATELSASATIPTRTVAVAVTDLPSASGVGLASAGTKILKTHRFHAAHSRADMIAKDTVIRYGTGSASRPWPAQNQP